MSEELKPDSVQAHSHASMYMVFHVRNGDGPNYESCHHCGFIRVPDLQKRDMKIREMSNLLKEATEKLGRMEKALEKIVAIPKLIDGLGMAKFIAKEALSDIKNSGGKRESLLNSF